MKKLMYFVSFAVMTLMSISCNNDDLDNVAPSENERVVHTAVMQFNGSVPSFDDDATTRAATDSWTNGAKIYLHFNSSVYGTATYNASNQEWSIVYYGTLTATNDGKCEAYYFENTGEEDYLTVKLSASTIIYVDKSASYTYEDNTLKVTANLKPMTGRIRMKGSANQEYYVEGPWLFYSSYNFTNNTFTTAGNLTITGNTGKDGYSEYYYVHYPTDTEKLFIANDKENNISFVKILGATALEAGKSGYLNIPSMQNNNGWTLIRFKDYEVGNITFRMMRVVGDGSSIARSFYIGETEVTQALWKAVMNNNPSSIQGDNLPVTNVNWENCKEFINKLNQKIGANFEFPTMAQWQFAAKGGNLSKNYTYSGSNNVGEVAWYNNNASSQPHAVKQKLPNEIGLYDMSGNVSEWTSTKYSSGSYYHCGGSYTSSVSFVMWNSAGSNGSSYWDNNIGLRLFSY